MLCDHIWAAQYQGAAEIPGMAVVPIHDTGISTGNIHPPYKKAVGERLAALALRRLYGKDVVATGSSFDSAQLTEGKVVVRFQDLAGELTTVDGETPSWFELSADGETFVAASATLMGSSVAVEIPENLAARYVRMGWRDIAIPNLQDGKTGWPVFAFPAQEIPQ